MSADRNADRIVRAWLDLMPDQAPDRTIAAVLLAVEGAPQVRRPLVRASWRSSPMIRFALIATAAGLVAALLGGALLAGGSRNDTVAPTAPPVVPSATPDATASPPGPAPASVRGNWLADAQATTVFGPADGDLRLVVSATGASAWVVTAAGRQGLHSDVSLTADDELTLSATVGVPGCVPGDEGRYRFAVSDDRLRLTLVPVDEPCASRADAFGRTWTRTHTFFSDGGTAVVPGVGPLFQVTLPSGSYQTRTITDAQEIYDTARDYILLAWKNPQGFASACSLAERYPWTPGAQAFVDYIRQNDAFTNVRTENVTVGGFPAIHLQFDSVDSYAACPGAEWLEQLVPKDATEGGWHIGFGEPDDYWVVDHPDATVLFQVLPVGDASAEEVIGSIVFPDALDAPAP